MNELTIQIYKSVDEPGYFFDIFSGIDQTDNLRELDGGFCTTSLKNAIDMACDQAKLLIINKNI